MAALTVRCPHCAAALKLNDRGRLGRKATCPKCGQTFVAQASAADLPPARRLPPARKRSAKTRDSAGRKSKESRRSNSSRTLFITGGALAAALLLGVGLWAAGVFSPSQAQAPAAPTTDSPEAIAGSDYAPAVPVAEPESLAIAARAPVQAEAASAASDTEAAPGEAAAAETPLPDAETVPSSIVIEVPGETPGRTVTQPQERLVIDTGTYTYEMSFSPDGSRLLGSCPEGQWRLWNVSDGRLLTEFRPPVERSGPCCFSPDGSFIIGGNTKGAVWAFDPATGAHQELANRGIPLLRIFFSPDGTRLIVSWIDGHAAFINLRGEVEREMQLAESLVELRTTSDSKSLVGATRSGQMVSWDLESGEPGQAVEFGGQEGDPRFSADGSVLAFEPEKSRIVLWDTVRRAETAAATLVERPVAAFHPDGRRILLTCWSSRAGGAVYLWNPPTAPVRLGSMNSAVHSRAWDPTGRLAAIASRDRKIHIWEFPPPFGSRKGVTEPGGEILAAWKASWTTPAAAGSAPVADMGADGTAAAAPAGGEFDTTFITGDFAAAVVVHPKRVLESDLYRAASEWPGLGVLKLAELFQQAAAIAPQDIAEVVVLFDREQTAALAGVPAAAWEQHQLTRMWEMGLSMGTYYDIHQEFPNAGNGAGASGGGLSWRVHLLEIDDPQLKDQFEIDEPWDSERNRQLARHMPRMYATRGGVGEGKTSLHVFVGKGAPFAGPNGPKWDDFTDDRSKTILIVEAGPEAAVEWSKPGGLEFDLANPKGVLGTLPEEGFMVLFADLSFARLRSDIPDELFKKLVTHQGGERISDEGLSKYTVSKNWSAHGSPLAGVSPPAVIVRFSRDVDARRLTNNPLIQQVSAIRFPDARTAILAPERTQQKMLGARGADSPLIRRLRQVGGSHDAAIVIDLSASPDRVAKLAEFASGFVRPAFKETAKLGARFEGALLTADVTRSDQPLLSLTLLTDSAETAKQMSQAVASIVSVGKAGYGHWRQGGGSQDLPRSLQLLLPLTDTVAEGVSANAEAKDFTLSIPKASGFERLRESVQPAITAAKHEHEQSERLRNLQTISVWMRNHHDNMGHVPYADRGPIPEDPNRGLGWRAYLVRFGSGEESDINPDEPWNGRQNRRLAARIPEPFVVAGVDRDKTTIHIFVGSGAPFGGDQPTRHEDISDGLATTIFAVQGGPETATEWMKPGGLKFDPQSPKAALGTIPDTGLPTLFFDGSLRLLSKDIPGDLLKALITHQGGETIKIDELERYTLYRERP